MEHIYRSSDDGVSVPDGILLHEYVLERDYLGRDSPAFVDGPSGRTITHQQVRNLSRNVAAGLHSLGLRHKDVVMILLPNMPEYASIFLGINKVGAIATTANPAYTPEELAKQAADSGTKMVITVAELLPRTALMASHPRLIAFGPGLPSDVTPIEFLFSFDGQLAPPTSQHSQSDTCALPYSSGTTGVAKGVVLSHCNFIANIEQQIGGSAPRLHSGEGDTILGVLPMFHIYGLNVLNLCPLRSGARVLCVPRFDMELVLRLMERERVTVAPLVPPIILGLTKLPLVAKFDLSSLKRIVSGAAPLDAKTEAALQKRFPTCRVGQGYGMTESAPVVTVSPCLSHRDPPLPRVPGSAGTLVPLTDAKIVDVASQRSLGPNESGELWVRGPQVMQGYLNNPSATSATLSPDGWLKTGDIGYFDTEGNLFLLDRAKELIKYKGFQVPPAELEGVLLSHPSVADAAVVPARDDEAGEVPVAFVVLRPNASPSSHEILQFVASQIAPYKRLKAIRFVSAIPKSASGKILRRELKSRL